MRDKLIHDYFGVDIDAVWDTVKRDIPMLKNKLKDLIEHQKREDMSEVWAAIQVFSFPLSERQFNPQLGD